MQKFFSVFYKRFFGSVFILWLFLWTAGKFGFGFMLDLRLFLRVLFLFFLVYFVWEVKTRRSVIFPILHALFLNARDEFFLKTETKRKIIVSSSPKIFANKTGNFLILVLAIVLSLFFFLRHFFRILSRFIPLPAVLLAFAILGTLADIFVFNFTSDLIIMVITGFWILVIWHFKPKEEVSLSGALALLAICPFLLIFNKDPVAEKVASWSYIFLTVGIGQQAISYLKKQKKICEN